MSQSDSTTESSSQSNVVTITDQSGTIMNISYVVDSLVITSGQPSTPPVTITKLNNVWTLTLNAGRSKTTPVANAFNEVCGGANNEYAPSGGGGTPSQLNFFFQIVIDFLIGDESGSVTIYLAQGSYGSWIDPTNNWWIGGANINYANGQPQIFCEVPGIIGTMPLSGGTSSFTVGPCHQTAASEVKYVFVLMLENHSFDNIFAMSRIPGIWAATTENSNSYGNQTYNVTSPARQGMVAVPGHEFQDVVEQLCGQGVTFQSGQPYPTINNSGFVANWATSTTEGPPSPPPSANYGDIMACFDVINELPMIYKLGSQCTVCDQWFSSLPGPTWPNRFFLHGASSAGLDHSPTTLQMATWESIFSDGFIYPNGSIFDALDAVNIPYGLFMDTHGPISGRIPQVSSIKGIHFWDVQPLEEFVTLLQGSQPYPYKYTFIEPNYGHTHSTYEDGSSEHPMDMASSGDALIQTVYEALVNSNIWNNSMLIITYDEHGGFYDSYIPPSAPPPNDNPPPGLNQFGFQFDQYGVRVPAVIVSPLIPTSVDHTLYDHTSVLATLETLFGLDPLTQRDSDANNLLQLIPPMATARTDLPKSLGRPAPTPARPPITPAQQMIEDQKPLPERGNLIGFLAITAKTDLEMSGGTPAERAAIQARVQAIKTRGQARAYMEDVLTRAEAARSRMRRRRP